MSLLPGKHIDRLSAGVHGGFDYTEFERLGIDPENIIDFSVSTNPLGIPPGIIEPITDIEASRYPDSRSLSLIREIARTIGVSEQTILAGAGSTELIRLAVTAYCTPADRAVVLGPTYGEYRTACLIANVEVTDITAPESSSFMPDIDIILKLILQLGPKIIFICNPNNPTGVYLGYDEIKAVVSAAPDSLIVLDEAYAAFADNRWDPVDLLKTGNLLILRSMTKDYAIAGLRLGYAIAHADIISILHKVAPPWNVNVAAQKVGLALIRQKDFLEQSRKAVHEGKEYLTDELTKLGFRCLPSSVNFFLIETDNASELSTRLLRKSILVRDCTSFGLPRHIRIAVQTPEANRAMITALKDMQHDR